MRTCWNDVTQKSKPACFQRNEMVGCKIGYLVAICTSIVKGCQCLLPIINAEIIHVCIATPSYFSSKNTQLAFRRLTICPILSSFPRAIERVIVSTFLKIETSIIPFFRSRINVLILTSLSFKRGISLSFLNSFRASLYRLVALFADATITTLARTVSKEVRRIRFRFMATNTQTTFHNSSIAKGSEVCKHPSKHAGER